MQLTHDINDCIITLTVVITFYYFQRNVQLSGKGSKNSILGGVGWSREVHFPTKQALLGVLAVKAFNARLLDALTIIISHLLELTIMFEAYLIHLLAP